jgi:SAM-dependent methyltransferase
LNHATTDVSPWLQRWAHLLRPGASVLDLACGGGRHVRWLAARGHAVTGVDRDVDSALPLRGLAEIIVADIENNGWPLGTRRFDAVIVTNYLWRPLLPAIEAALADRGVLVYETFSIDQAAIGRPSNPQFLLRRGELLAAFAALRVIAYEDGFVDAPERFVQRLVAAREERVQPTPAQPTRYPLQGA